MEPWQRWIIVPVLKTGEGNTSVGSNPTGSAYFNLRIMASNVSRRKDTTAIRATNKILVVRFRYSGFDVVIGWLTSRKLFHVRSES